ncbi:MAG: SpoIIE family protein phosphatase [candidate division KSB1 bacterium]|nr:SpoIIE family protein phosphatase [candidate division KSB1 bacterium]MDZ7367853.1 SpoIIE family protein phosphatase [candidate division KSB1 bacterium]MDZ7405529.1 SpoIIE family protein phosphatase [candidate division KSB1 bacterium]
MRIQGEKKKSEKFPSLLLRANPGGNPTIDSFHERRRHDERATMFRENGAGAPFLPSENGNGHAPARQHELRMPRPIADSSDEGTAIFPYIPRKRQERNGLLIDYLYLPAPDAAGDQVDFFILGENRVGVLLADVAGDIDHDNVPIIKTALRSNSAGLSTAATLRHLDQRLAEVCANGCAITAVYSIFDQNKRLLHFASAGHLPMLIYRPTSGKVYLLNASGSPFGASVNTNLPANGFWDSASEAGAAINGPSVLKSERVALRQNDLLVLYSDGLLAARNASGEVWGRQRLLEFVRTFGELNPTDFLVELKQTLEKFSDGRAAADDITVVVLKNILRDLDKPHPEACGCELESRFLTANEEQALLTILRENSDIEVTEILARLASSEYAYLSREQIETHLAQLRPWLQPWRGRHGRSGSKTASVAAELNKNGVAESAASSKKQFHENLLAAFPLRQLLEKRYEFRGSSPEMAQALRFYDNGDYEQALEAFLRLRTVIRNSAPMHCFFGNLYLLLKNPAKAQHEFVAALQLDPHCVHALLSLGYIALLSEDYSAAIDSLTTALRLNKNLQPFDQFAEKLIAAVERLGNRYEWIV